MNENPIKNITNKDKIEPTPESIYKAEVEKRAKFLSSQKGVDVEGTKRFNTYEKFKENPAQHLIDLYKKDLEKEFEFLNKLERESEFIDNTPDSTIEMHLRNIDMLSRKIALFEKFGKKAEIDMLENGTEESMSKENREKTLESFANKQFLDDKFKTLSSKFSKRINNIKYYALALMFSSSPVMSQNSLDIKDGDKNKLEDTRVMNTSNEKIATGKTADWNMYRNKLISEKGINPNFILTQGSLEYRVDETTIKETTMNVPFTYAPDFETTDFTNKDDALKIDQSLRDQIRSNFANELYRIGETRGSYRANHKEDNDLLKNKYSNSKITSIKITGYSSPEGSTKESIIPGNEEKGNIDLAKKRAEIGRLEIKKILEENQIDLSVLDSVNYEEVQFSDVEMDKLADLADSLGIDKQTEEDNILELISKYNDGEYNENHSIKNIMDEIVGNKRRITIEIEYENTEKKQVVVAIPLLLLLFVSKRIRRGLNPNNWGSHEDHKEAEEIKEEEKIDNAKDKKIVVKEDLFKKGTIFSDGLFYYKIISNNPLWRLGGNIKVVSKYIVDGEERIMFLNKKEVEKFIKKGTMQVLNK